MPDLSDLFPFHSGQVENFYLLVLGEDKNIKLILLNSVFNITCTINY